MSVKNRGFASIDPKRQREIASRGGKAVDPSKRTFSVDRKLAVRAGRIGGQSKGAAKVSA
jgi:general stress protein YciG